MDWEAEDSPEIVPATGKPLNVTRHHGRLPITEDENPFTQTSLRDSELGEHATFG